MQQQVLSITQISEYIRTLMDKDTLLTGLAVCGEISNYKMYPSGHHYFTLKDETSSLKCVMFRSSAIKLRFRPENGMKVIALGKISVYPRDGVYQLYCTAMSINGVGDLYAAFEQLKAKLAAQGLFNPSHKKALPPYPGVIGIITSSAGAAVHDMLRILRKRYPLVKVRLFPVRVQGVEAPGEICDAIQYTNMYRLADLLIVGRGGGSIEDLWAFNDEQVAHAIYNSQIPVISAVGHEPDVTISDFVADLRAATPSNAAELAVPDQNVLRQNLDTISNVMLTALQQKITTARKQLRIISESPALQSPDVYIQQRRKTLTLQHNRMYLVQNQKIHHLRQRFLAATAKLDAMSPLKVLTRGYAMVQNSNGTIVHSVHHVCENEQLQIRLFDGVIDSKVISKKEDIL